MSTVAYCWGGDNALDNVNYSFRYGAMLINRKFAVLKGQLLECPFCWQIRDQLRKSIKHLYKHWKIAQFSTVCDWISSKNVTENLHLLSFDSGWNSNLINKF